MSTFKLPPDPSAASNYKLWRKDALIWKKLTDVAADKKGLALQYACRSNERIHRAVTDLPDIEVECAAGFENVLACLDRLFKTDQKDEEVKCYHDFETIQRKDDQTIADFINEFDSLLNKTKDHGNVFSDTLLATKLIIAANLSKSEQLTVKATTIHFDYSNVRTTLLRTFGEFTGIEINSNVGLERAFHQCSHEEVFRRSESNYNSSQGGHQMERGDYCSNPGKVFQFYGENSQRERYTYQGNYDRLSQQQQFPTRMKNQLDPKRNVTRCNICESRNHFAAQCPDIQERSSVKNGGLYEIVMFQSDLDESENIASLEIEAIGAGVADCVVSKTVCGRKWLLSYIDLLSEEDKQRIEYKTTTNEFKLDIGKPCKAYTTALIPIYLGKKKVTLETDVISENLPLLLSKVMMKRAGTKINTARDEIEMLGETIQLIYTNSGHYAVPLTPKVALINKFTCLDHDNVKDRITFLIHNSRYSKQEMAVKLHQQFGHPSLDKLFNLVNKSDLADDKELKELLQLVTENCETCKHYKRPSQTPEVELPFACAFNEVVSVNISFYQDIPLLHLIDCCTRFSTTIPLHTKNADDLADSISNQWISIFGCPKVFICGGGADKEIRVAAQVFNIPVIITGTESHWSKVTCEKNNQVLVEMLDKIRCEVDCSLSVALVWATSAKNSLPNIRGFSPAQLVFGCNPLLPSVSNNLPPAMSETSYSDAITSHLKFMKTARESHVNAGLSGRARRTISQKTLPHSDVKYINGDKVYFMCSNETQAHGQGVVIGQDSSFVLVRHQSTWIRLHTSRLQLIEGNYVGNESDDEVTPVSEAIQMDIEEEFHDTQDLEIFKQPRTTTADESEGIKMQDNRVNITNESNVEAETKVTQELKEDGENGESSITSLVIHLVLFLALTVLNIKSGESNTFRIGGNLRCFIWRPETEIEPNKRKRRSCWCCICSVKPNKRKRMSCWTISTT